MQERAGAIISFVNGGLGSRILGIRERRYGNLGSKPKGCAEEFLPQEGSFTHQYG